MDRDELQDRIRARRSGGEPFRRGTDADDPRLGYERFEPDPIDALAVRAPAQEEERADHFDESAQPAPERPPDLTRDRDEWGRPPSPVAGVPPVPPPVTPDWSEAPSPETPGEPVVEEVGYGDEADAYDQSGYAYESYEAWDDGRGRSRGGAGAFAIFGFLALGVLALLTGAFIAGLMGGGPIGQGDATPTPLASAEASIEPTPLASEEPSASADASPGESGGPVVFPDGFVAEAQPCLPGSANGSGCDSNGADNNGVVDIWVGFQNGNANDVVGATIVAPDGSSVDGSIDLARIGCGQACNGWTYFPFRNLGPGTYEVRITRNGEPAGSTTFEVSA